MTGAHDPGEDRVADLDERFRRAVASHLLADVPVASYMSSGLDSTGIASEATRATVLFGFQELGLARIYAQVLAGNVASMRVLEKLGMVNEGTKRQHVKKGRQLHDIVLYGLLRSEWNA